MEILDELFIIIFFRILFVLCKQNKLADEIQLDRYFNDSI